MEKKKRNPLTYFYGLALVFMFSSVIIEIFAAKKSGFGILDILALVFIVFAIGFVFVPLGMIYHQRKKEIQLSFEKAKENPQTFFDALLNDYREHNLSLDVENSEKKKIAPILDYQRQVAIYYHTLLGDKNHLLLLDVYFYQNECVILFDEGKVFEKAFAYQKDDQVVFEDTKELYYVISNQIKEAYQDYLTHQEVLKL